MKLHCFYAENSLKMAVFLFILVSLVLSCNFLGDKSIRVNGTDSWVDSGVTLSEGNSYTVSASGGINPCADSASDLCIPYGPEGMTNMGTVNQADPQEASNYPLPGAIIGSLVGKIGDNPPFAVGSGGTLSAGSTGILYFQINDYPLSNNSGYWDVDVVVN